MKLNKILGFIAFSAIFSIALTSCGKDDNGSGDTEVVQSVNQCMALCTQGAQDTPVYLDGVGFNLHFNYTKKIATVTISGLSLPNGTSYPELKLNNVKVNVENTAKIISGMNVTPTSTGYNPPTFSSFRLYLMDRFITDDTNNAVYHPFFYVHLTIGEYTLLILPQNIIEFGTTTATTAGAEPFTNRESAYSLEFRRNPNNGSVICDLNIPSAQFDSHMPQLNMVFPAIDVTVDPAKPGTFMLKSDALTPSTIGSNNMTVPQPGFPITNLNGAVDVAQGMNLKFVCGVRNVPYDVDVKCANTNE